MTVNGYLTAAYNKEYSNRVPKRLHETYNDVWLVTDDESLVERYFDASLDGYRVRSNDDLRKKAIELEYEFHELYNECLYVIPGNSLHRELYTPLIKSGWEPIPKNVLSMETPLTV